MATLNNALCPKCKHKVSTKGVEPTCFLCKGIFHGTKCLGMKPEDVEYIITNKTVWRCPQCELTDKAQMKGDETPISPLVRRDINKQLAQQKSPNDWSDSIKLLCEKMDGLLKKNDEIVKSIEFCHESIKELNEKMTNYCSRVHCLEERMEELERKSGKVLSEFAEHQIHLNRVEQDTKLNTLEIGNVPSMPNETPQKIVIDIGLALGVKLDESDISNVYRQVRRTGSESTGTPPRIIVSFTRRVVTEEFQQARRVKRNLNTSHIGWKESHPIYINPYLTSYYGGLYAKARKLRKEGRVKFAWIRGGKVMVRKEEGSPAIVVEREQDLPRV